MGNSSNRLLSAKLSAGEYSGNIVSDLCCNDVRLCTTKYDKVDNNYWHSHENLHISLVFDNALSETKKNRNYTSKSGTLVLLREDQIHRYTNGDGKSLCYNLEMPASFLSNYQLSGEKLAKKVEDNSAFKLNFLRLFTSTKSSEDTISNILELFHENKESFKKMPKWMNKLHELLNDEWQHNRSLDDLSSLLGVHPVTISKYFSSFFNCTLSMYKRRIKIDRSIPLLLSDNLSILEVALLCNFSDQSHYTREFKKLVGITPREFILFNTRKAKSVIK